LGHVDHQRHGYLHGLRWGRRCLAAKSREIQYRALRCLPAGRLQIRRKGHCSHQGLIGIGQTKITKPFQGKSKRSHGSQTAQATPGLDVLRPAALETSASALAAIRIRRRCWGTNCGVPLASDPLPGLPNGRRDRPRHTRSSSRSVAVEPCAVTQVYGLPE
jgi:hypothetical protein